MRAWHCFFLLVGRKHHERRRAKGRFDPFFDDPSFIQEFDCDTAGMAVSAIPAVSRQIRERVFTIEGLMLLCMFSELPPRPHNIRGVAVRG